MESYKQKINKYLLLPVQTLVDVLWSICFSFSIWAIHCRLAERRLAKTLGLQCNSLTWWNNSRNFGFDEPKEEQSVVEYHHPCRGRMSAFAANWESWRKHHPLNPSSPQSPHLKEWYLPGRFGHTVSAPHVDFFGWGGGYVCMSCKSSGGMIWMCGLRCFVVRFEGRVICK